MRSALRELAASRLDSAPADLSEDDLRRVLSQIAMSPASKPADRLRAVELLGRAMGMFDEVQDRRPSFADLVLAVPGPRGPLRRRVGEVGGSGARERVEVVCRGWQG